MSETAGVAADQFWNRTGIRVEAGAVYDIEADGAWNDASIPSGPDGYSSNQVAFFKVPFFRLAESRRRLPSANWFALIGAIDTDESTQFVIGGGKLGYRPQKSGELTCFANDLRSKYDNNSGEIRLTVTRRSRP